tara:strand:- start:1533 stop:1787 length:255 start_codon:yes stop_codon:yes gene_type:complete
MTSQSNLTKYKLVMSPNQISLLNFTLNKFCPTAIIAFLVFFKMGFYAWEPYIVAFLVLFTQQFHYKIGYSVAICEERGLLPDEY